MKILALLFSLGMFTACGAKYPDKSVSTPPDHSSFTTLLQKYVTESGFVDYKGLNKNHDQLKKYLELLQDNPPSKDWSDSDEIAYWINAYNAFTLELILKHYPLKSIKDIGSSISIPFINSPWDIKFIEIGGEEYDLNNIEHGILRERWEEPRIHFAVNCASFSCPKLRNEAYTGDRLEEQLEDQARDFINDETKNKITGSKAKVSKLFDWYGGDFKKKKSVKDFINQYADTKIEGNTDLTWMDYDWSLNEQ